MTFRVLSLGQFELFFMFKGILSFGTNEFSACKGFKLVRSISKGPQPKGKERASTTRTCTAQPSALTHYTRIGQGHRGHL